MKQPERITETHIYFWGSFYSQWAKYYITDSSLQQKFSSCEQYMMYHKAILFNDEESATKILETTNVKKQKELGRKVKGFNQKEWDKHKFNIIVKGNLLKFSQNEDIQKELLSSGEKILVEASPYDKIYGVGLKWDNDLILDEKNWKGENLLGKALMKVRDIIRTQNGDKLKELFNQPAISQEEYNDEISKELNDSTNFDKDVKKNADDINEENFGEKLLESANEALAHVKGEKELKTIEVKLYDKLIRDKIPQIIHKNKKQCETYKEEDKNKLLKYYIKKIEEEIKEVVSSQSKEELIEELADLSEVMDGLLENLNLKDSVLEAKEKKKNERGGFSNLILKSVRSEKHEWIKYKNDSFYSCKKCGVIQNEKNINSNCIGKVELKLRDKSERKDFIQKVTSDHEEVENLVVIEGSIIDAKEDIIAHGCNCVGSFGSGIAKYMADNFPESKEEYVKICKDKKFKLGDVQFVKSNGKIIANCATQYYYGKFLKMDKKSIEQRYLAIEKCLQHIYTKAKKDNLSVAIPPIGCGRARMKWERVEKIIRKVFHDYPVTLYYIPDRYFNLKK